jgi:sigma-B regulation protein RsbU (phosphoserine phosphatase)
MSSAALAPAFRSRLQSQLLDRRERLQATISALDKPQDLVRLLTEVDSALSRLEGAEYGVCRICLLPVAEEDLIANPMMSYCLCELSSDRQRALERDLDLAWQVQSALLPPLGLCAGGWETHYRYVPHGPVSGDYCDVVVPSDGSPNLYFMLGDVSGKGVSASLLMSHLNALMRSLAQQGLSPEELMTRANGTLSENTLVSHYATMVCGTAGQSGELKIINAGHCKPVVVRSNGGVDLLEQGNLPLGLAFDEPSVRPYVSQTAVLDKGDTLVLYTDGLTEAANAEGEDYGMARLLTLLSRCGGDRPKDLVAKCLADVAAFLDGADRSDDLTILAVARCGA